MVSYQYQLAIGLTQKIFNHYYENVKYFFKNKEKYTQKEKDLDAICEMFSQQPFNNTKEEEIQK